MGELSRYHPLERTTRSTTNFLLTLSFSHSQCTTGIFVHHDIVRGTSEQRHKKYQIPPVKSHLPRGENVSYATAEVLRQAEESKVEKGGWVGGDAWFGSIESCVELNRRLGLYSTFIVKQNVNYFPMQILHDILIARHGSRPAGHWVVMQANISGVDLFVMAYAWSQKGVAYFVSSCGTTVQHEKAYLSRFEDEYGNVQEKALPRPTIAHFLYEFLPLIDEHNKTRQSALALEKSWLTKNPWVRLITTFLGMSVVDMQRWDRNKRYRYNLSNGVSDIDDVVVTFVDVDDFDIRTMANLISRPLTSGKFRYRTTEQPSARTSSSTVNDRIQLVRICDEFGSETYRPRKEGGRVRVRQMGCHICKQYQHKAKNTQWKCIDCNMPLCQKDRSSGTTNVRECDCYEEHKRSDDREIGCFPNMNRTAWVLPASHHKYMLSRAQKEARNGKRNAQVRQISHLINALEWLRGGE